MPSLRVKPGFPGHDASLPCPRQSLSRLRGKMKQTIGDAIELYLNLTYFGHCTYLAGGIVQLEATHIWSGHHESVLRAVSQLVARLRKQVTTFDRSNVGLASCSCPAHLELHSIL